MKVILEPLPFGIEEDVPFHGAFIVSYMPPKLKCEDLCWIYSKRAIGLQHPKATIYE